jgi:hypothetical protein
MIATLFATAACSSGSPAASAPPATLAAASASVNGCTAPAFDYIERDVAPKRKRLRRS